MKPEAIKITKTDDDGYPLEAEIRSAEIGSLPESWAQIRLRLQLPDDPLAKNLARIIDVIGAYRKGELESEWDGWLDANQTIDEIEKIVKEMQGGE